MSRCLTIGVSARALFDMEKEHALFLSHGTTAYVEYELAHERDVSGRGPAFALIKALLDLNRQAGERKTEVVIISKNSAESALRIFYSIEQYGLDITKAALTAGKPTAPYLNAFGVDLYLAADEEDVRGALECDVAAGLVLRGCRSRGERSDQIRIAFDGDAVLFSGDAERVFREQGVEAFCRREKEMALEPLERGPFANLAEMISTLQKGYPEGQAPIRTALVTARCAPAHERVIRTLRGWNVRIDEVFFLGGMDKSRVLEAFGAHIFFDDSELNTSRTSRVVLTARVPAEKKGA